MKLFLILLCFAPLAQAQKSVAFSWAARSTPGYKVCSVGPNCLTGFTLTDSLNGQVTTVGQYSQSATGTTVSPMPSVGSHVFSLAQNYTDQAGVAHATTGNPGIVVNCYRNSDKVGRYCTYGKVWAGQ